MQLNICNLRPVVGYLESVATLERMMEDELRLGDPGTSTPPRTSPTSRVGEHSIRGLLGQREREHSVALKMNSVSQVMGALELLDPEAGDLSSAYGNEPPTSGWANQTHQQPRLGEVLGDREYDDAGDPPTTVEHRSCAHRPLSLGGSTAGGRRKAQGSRREVEPPNDKAALD